MKKHTMLRSLLVLPHYLLLVDHEEKPLAETSDIEGHHLS
jgi:hypothetical protein